MIPSLLCKMIINADIRVITPRPPIWIITRITICPKRLQVEKVGSVTRPVTQVAVVAVNNASVYGMGIWSAELIGSANSRLPSMITLRKLRMII